MDIRQRNTVLEFWFAVGSTYTYLTVMRIADVCKNAGVDLLWKPYNIRQIMSETDNLPFPDSKPHKQAYMWRDIERRAHKYGLPMKMPVDYPLQNFDRANRIAVLAEREGWCSEYTTEAYRVWFQDGLPAGTIENIAETLRRIGRSVPDVIEQCNQPVILGAYDRNTDEAREKSVFGAPSFVVDGELFWGDDRLEDAIDWISR